MSDSRSTQDQLDDALDALRHIEVVCQKSRSQSRRIRWIAVRARDGQTGDTNHQRVDLPKSVNSEEKETIRRIKAEKLCEEMSGALKAIKGSVKDVLLPALNKALAELPEGHPAKQAWFVDEINFHDSAARVEAALAEFEKEDS